MSFSFTLHFGSEDEQPTTAQCEAVNKLLIELVQTPVFDNVEGFLLEVPEPSDFDRARLQQAN